MASVEVFVDDAVRGRLPHVCAKTGVPADGKLRIRQTGGRVGPAVLLVFLGPLGWIALFVISWAAGRFGELNVRLPYSQRAADHESHLRHDRLIAFAVAGFALLVALLCASRDHETPAGLFAGAAILAAVVGAVQHVRLQRAQVGVRLDASRRWVILTGVHPDFARAVEARAALESNPR